MTNVIPTRQLAVNAARAILTGVPVLVSQDLYGDDYEAVRELNSALTEHGQEGLNRVFPAIAGLCEWLKPLRPDFVAQSDSSPFIHADDLINLVQPVYMIDGYPVYSVGLNLLFGRSGSGKSFVAVDIGARAAKAMPVAYVVGEGVSGYQQRWEAWKDFNSYDEKRPYFFHQSPVQLLNHDQLWTFIENCRTLEIKFIIVDTLARMAVGMEENSALSMGLLVEACDTIIRELDAAVLIVHHTGANEKLRGSTALYAACDSVLALTNNDNMLRISNHTDNGGKNKHRAPDSDLFFRLIPRLDSAVLAPDEKVLDVVEKDALTPNQWKILEALDGYDSGLFPKNITDATNLDRATVYRQLKRMLKSEIVTKSSEDRYVITDTGRDYIRNL